MPTPNNTIATLITKYFQFIFIHIKFNLCTKKSVILNISAPVGVWRNLNPRISQISRPIREPCLNWDSSFYLVAKLYRRRKAKCFQLCRLYCYLFKFMSSFLLLNTIIDSIRKYMHLFFPDKRFFHSIYPSRILLLNLQLK